MSKNPSIRTRAIQLYNPPFRYERGYIWDCDNNMVADDVAVDPFARIRGWGRISHMEHPEKLQDEVGKLIAEILTTHWPKMVEK